MGVTAVLNTVMICRATGLKGGFGVTLMTIALFSALSAATAVMLANLCEAFIGGAVPMLMCCAAGIAVYLILATVFDTAEISLLWKNLLPETSARKKQKKPLS